MKHFFKAQLSSLLATLVDFLIMVLSVEAGKLHYVIAATLGACCGALVNFIINRYWSFKATHTPAKQQGFRYSLVWIGSILLNVSGIYVLTHFLQIKYILSKIIVAIIVGLGFNYTLQKEYVFNTNEKISTK